MNVRVLLCAGLAAVALAACGTEPAADAPVDSGGEPAAGACLVGDPDCEDMGPGSGPATDFPIEAVRAGAQDLLGRPEADLPETIRVARRGGEQFMLTEDYVEGRVTVELDPDDSGAFVVTKVTVEMPDGPETFEG